MRSLSALLWTATAATVGLEAAEPPNAKALLGGATTIFTETGSAFSQSAANLPLEKLVDFAAGNRVFNTSWTIAGGSVELFDGVGPLFNRASCSGCHVHDGRGQPPERADRPMLSMLLRISVPGVDERGGPKPHPIYGGQLQDRANLGFKPEAQVQLSWEERPGTFPDGERYSLRRPRWRLENWSDGEPGAELLVSARTAPAVFGLGLLEAARDETILVRVDADDKDGDGISGRANQVWDATRRSTALGRFGWKAGQPTLRQQTAAAFREDMGLTTKLFAEDGRTAVQREAHSALEGGSPEVEERLMDRLEFYLRTLAVPARRRLDDPKVQAGEALFEQLGCTKCHVPQTVTGDAPVPQLSRQTIYPYSDLLLHDMGDALADGRPEFGASGREWRTAPLWGIGLQPIVSKHHFLLHDGRARGLLEAILWHGGEAEASRKGFEAIPLAEREAVVEFLKSL